MEGQKTKLLIVDDEEAVANAFMKQLTLIGNFDVAIALGGKQALEMLSSQKFDAMLLDLVMPEVDGVEVLRSMKAEPTKYAPIPVLVLTNVTSDEAKKQTTSYGVLGYIVKTDADPEKLIADIENAIASFKQQGQAQAA